MKSILITGTKGYIGTSFQKYIDKRNCNMPPENQWHIVFLSVRDESWRNEDFGKYDAIIHVAAIVHKKEQPEMEQLYENVNCRLTVELAQKYKRDREHEGKEAHFVFFSTMSVYGILKGKIDAGTSLLPNNFYGKSKLLAEQELLALCKEEESRFLLSIVRPPMIYGRSCSGNYASLEKLAKKIPFFPNMKNQRSMLYVENLCEFLRLLIQKAQITESGKVYCPQNREYVNTAKLVKQIRSCNGKRTLLIPGFSWLIRILAERITVFTKVFGSLIYEKQLSEYRELGNYQIVDFEESIRRSSAKESCKNEGDSIEKNTILEPSEKVSVLMSLYIKEKPEYFRAAMDSILAQNYRADEIVLIEDGPLTEELYAAVEEYEKKCNGIDEPRLVIHAFEKNMQLGRALAKGVELCKNELIARMDTDDIACPDRLYKETLFMENHKEVSVVGGAIREFNDEGTVDRIKQMPQSQEEILEYSKVRNPLNHMTVMYRRTAILEIGNYMHFPFLEDYSLWSRMLVKNYQIRNLPDILVNARTSMGLVKRRSGWQYYQLFKRLRKMQHKLGMTNALEYIRVRIGTFVILMMPGRLKEFIYKTILRK